MKANLTISEFSKFQELDETIRHGAKTFMAVGHALVKMHEGKLYRTLFKTFKEYAESRGIGHRQAYRLMEAVQLTLEIENVSRGSHDLNAENIEQLKKSSAKTILALAKVPKKSRAKVLKSAIQKSGGKLTGKIIEVEADEISHKPKRDKKDAREPEKVTVESEEIIDVGFMLTPAEFQKKLDALEKLIPENADHEKFGIIANKFVERQMNFKSGKKEFNPYTRN